MSDTDPEAASVHASAADAVYRLDDLLARIIPGNLHREVDSGATIGLEAW